MWLTGAAPWRIPSVRQGLRQTNYGTLGHFVRRKALIWHMDISSGVKGTEGHARPLGVEMFRSTIEHLGVVENRNAGTVSQSPMRAQYATRKRISWSSESCQNKWRSESKALNTVCSQAAVGVPEQRACHGHTTRESTKSSPIPISRSTCTQACPHLVHKQAHPRLIRKHYLNATLFPIVSTNAWSLLHRS